MKKSMRYFNLAQQLLILETGNEIVIQRDNWKYKLVIVESAISDLGVNPTHDEFLYDIDNDPNEMVELSAEQPQIMAQLRVLYQQWTNAIPSNGMLSKIINKNRTKLDL